MAQPDMDSLSRLESLVEDIFTTGRILFDMCKHTKGTDRSWPTPSTPNSSIWPGNGPSDEIHGLRRSMLAKVCQLQATLLEPADFIQQLAYQSQLVACLHWLGEFQVQACIPLCGSVPARDIADIVGVPEAQLCRVVRMTATSGFLQEPRPGYIAHTPLSAAFVTNLSYFDAVMFVAETLAPAAMQMTAVTTTRHSRDKKAGDDDSPFMLASKTRQTFEQAWASRPKLQRQWPAYLSCTGDREENMTELLRRLDWQGLGKAYVVDVVLDANDAFGLADMLAEDYPALRLVVQMSQPRILPNKDNARVAVQRRAPGTPQTTKNAAAYILRLRNPTLPGLSSDNIRATIKAEMRAHLDVLRSNPSATFIIACHFVLSDPSTVATGVDTVTRLRDLTLMQLANDGLLELVELVEMVNSSGHLAVTDKLVSRSSSAIALCIKYRTLTEMEATDRLAAQFSD